MPAFGIEHRALAGVEMRRFLQHQDGRLDRVDRLAAAREHGLAGIERAIEIGADRALLFGRKSVAVDHAGAAVDDERGRTGAGRGGTIGMSPR